MQITTTQNKEVDMIEPIPKKNKFLNIVSIISLILLGLIISIFLYWMFQPTDVLEIKNSPVPSRIVDDPQGNGKILILKINYCKKVKATGTVRPSFVSKSSETFLPSYKDDQPVQCNGGNTGAESVDLSIFIPKDLPPDKYKVKYRIIYKVNPLKSSEPVEFESVEFDLTADAIK